MQTAGIKTQAIMMVLLCTISPQIQAEPAKITIDEPSAIATIPGKEVGYVAIGKNQVWYSEDVNSNEPKIIVENLATVPNEFISANHVEYRRNMVSVFGVNEGGPSVATFRVEKGTSKTPQYLPGGSGPLNVGENGQIVATTATRVATYLAVENANGHSVWILNADSTKPTKLFDSETRILALAMSFQGHLLTAIRKGEDDVILRFRHASTGDALIDVPTDFSDVRSLAYSPSEIVFATGTKAEKAGVFRVDVEFVENRQVGKTTEVLLQVDADRLTCVGEQAILTTADSVIRFDLP